jgi:hypothetical protein
MDILPRRDTLMAYPMLGTAVCPETLRLMVILPYFIIGKKGKKISGLFPKLG